MINSFFWWEVFDSCFSARPECLPGVAVDVAPQTQERAGDYSSARTHVGPRLPQRERVAPQRRVRVFVYGDRVLIQRAPSPGLRPPSPVATGEG
ncbi:hypothetical protein BH09CHL1_BH09CHL1_27850 [soil metagenome]